MVAPKTAKEDFESLARYRCVSELDSSSAPRTATVSHKVSDGAGQESHLILSAMSTNVKIEIDGWTADVLQGRTGCHGV